MRQLFSNDELSALIGAIYDCALDRERWPDALHRIRTALDFASSVMSLIAYPSGRLLLNVSSGLEPHWQAKANDYGADAIDAWGGHDSILALPVDRPHVLSRLRSPADWRGNRYFTEWALPQGLIDTLAVPLSLDRMAVGSVAFGRHESRGEIGDIEVEAARLLLPHLQRAVAIGRILEFRSLMNATVAGALDALAAGVILVAADLGIVHANAAAQQMLARSDPVRADYGRLSVRPSPVAAALAEAVRQAADKPAGLGRRGIGIPVAAANGTPTVIHVLPLQIGSLLPDVAPRAVAAIFVAMPEAPVSMPVEALAALYDLTSAEAKVFNAIAAGRTRAEAARLLDIGEETVKTHLSHIFLKTGTRRQADLVALKASLTLPLRGQRTLRCSR